MVRGTGRARQSRWTRGVAVAVCAVVVTGCGAAQKAGDTARGAGEKAAEEAIAAQTDGIEDVEVDAEAGTVTFEGPTGTWHVGEDLAVPKSFPDDVPLPEGGHTVNAFLDERGLVEVTTLVTDTDLTAHEERVRGGLVAAGYTVGKAREVKLGDLPQRLLPAQGHGTRVEVRFGVAMGRASVHYAISEG